ncbi:hypothetical protein Afe04nite_48740 [Asanoa ferruginea]|uniref:hypothetical protein n=1 Tax=Asanoa ferruginea TaxID=53367 RepID=UPI0011C1B901|nr:hypothetical protein [Asanoa ferruginea]GIF50335.1 hypothetical protein Afe04nite_48740 [Asanoa ferruginea]
MAATLLLAGCTAEPIPAARPTAPPSEPPVELDTQDCGALSLRLGQNVPASVLQCVIDAAGARRPARLVITRPTVEGDPFTTSYAVAVDGRVEVTTDARADRFGSGQVERQTCAGPTVQDDHWLSFATCSSPELVGGNHRNVGCPGPDPGANMCRVSLALAVGGADLLTTP